MRPERAEVSPIRLAMVLVLVALWGARLTRNWLCDW
jgi:steroid 5-alpha reductase family enzyme